MPEKDLFAMVEKKAKEEPKKEEKSEEAVAKDAEAKAIEKIRIPQSNIPNISKTILTNLRIIQMFPIISIMGLPHG